MLQTAGFIMLLIGVFSKMSAIFVTIPEPVIGGMYIVMFGENFFLIACIEYFTNTA